MSRPKIEGERTTFTLRLPVTLLARLEEMASRQGRSINSLCNLVLEEHVQINPNALPVNEGELRVLVEKMMHRFLAERNPDAVAIVEQSKPKSKPGENDV